jgi:hypothetical protein
MLPEQAAKLWREAAPVSRRRLQPRGGCCVKCKMAPRLGHRLSARGRLQSVAGKQKPPDAARAASGCPSRRPRIPAARRPLSARAESIRSPETRLGRLARGCGVRRSRRAHGGQRSGLRAACGDRRPTLSGCWRLRAWALPLTRQGDAVSPDEKSAALRARAARARWFARALEYDEAGPRLRALADKLEAEATALDAAGNDDVATL